MKDPMIQSIDLKTLGIDETKFRNLSQKEQKEFLRLHALEGTAIVKARKNRKQPDLSIPRKTSFRYILAYLWVPYKGLFILSVILSVIQALLFVGMPIMVQRTVNDLLRTHDINIVWSDFLLTLVIIFSLAIVMYLKIYINAWMGVNIIKDLRDDMFKAIQNANSTFLDLNQTGDLLSRNTSDINLLKTLLSTQLAMFIRQALTFILAVVAMFYINFRVALYAIWTIPIIFIIMYYYRNKMRPLFQYSREVYGQLTSEAQENITGMRVVRAFAQEEREIKKFKKWNDDYYNTHQKLIKYDSSFEPIVRLFANISMILVIWAGSKIATSNPASFGIGDFFSLIILINFSIEPLFFISRFLADMAKVGATCDRVVEILLNKKTEPSSAINKPDLPKIRGTIEFDHVYLSYSNDDHYELKDITFKTIPGEKIAILGATGSGKSSLIKLISRFYEVSKGTIKIDGIDIRDVNLHSLRSQIGIVPQETFLFGRSLLDNLRLGRPDASMEEIIRATKLSNIHEFIDSLPQKYDTIVGERGVTLSGGQKQRISIARALIIKPPVLIFDDATSSVDVDTEYAIQQSFKEMFQNSTTFIITQRLSTVRNADRILVLEHGKLAEMGSHTELLKNTNGIYYKLYNTLRVEERSKWS